MARIAPNADIYAAARVGIFFPAHNQTNADGNLTGQCVTLLKWFFAEMTSIPAPFAARGDAKNVGRNLVAQGHAIEVPWAERRRGDIICYEYGIYGHIASQLSGGRVFESNVNIGVARRLVDGTYVYASRIASENEAWRAGKNPHVYRLKSYVEEGEDVKIGAGENWYHRFNRFHHQLVRNADLPREVFNQIVGLDAWKVLESWSDHPEADQLIAWQEKGEIADKHQWDQQIYGLQDERNIARAELLKAQQQLADSVSKKDLEAANQAIADATAKAKAAEDALNAKIEEDVAADTQAQGLWRAFLRLIGKG